MLKNKYLPYFLIIGLGILIYSNTFHSSFQFDDYTFLVNQPQNIDLHNIKAIWKDAYPYPTRFITFLTFAINYSFFKFDVFGYHAVNLLIHLINAFLVRWLILLLLQTRRLKDSIYAQNKKSFALIAALLFLVHPLQTQAVTYIAQRFASLSTLFYLASVCFYIRGRLNKSSSAAGNSFFIFCTLSAVLSMFSKETAFTLPFAIILTEAVFFIDKEHWQKHKKAYLIGTCFALSFCLIIPILFSADFFHILSAKSESFSHLGDTISIHNYLLTQFRVLLTYLRLFIFPVNQNFDYDYPASNHFFEPQTFFSFLALALILFGAIRALKNHPLISYGVFWFFLTSSVESSFFPIRHVIFEHRVYLPSAGFFLAICALTFYILKNPKRFVSIFYFLVAVCSVLTFERNKVWKTEIAFWEDCARKSPQKSRVHTNLAVAYLVDGQTDLALNHFNRAIEINPKDIQALNGRGAILTNRGEHAQAILDFDQVLKIESNSPLVYLNKAKNLAMQSKFTEAYAEIDNALKLDSHYAKAYITRGDIYKSQQKWDEALKAYQMAVQLAPYNAEPYYNIGKIYLVKGDSNLALKSFTKCLEIDPQNTKAREERDLLLNRHLPEESIDNP